MNPYCAKMRKHLDDYHDGELSSFLRRLVEKHLGTCAGCRREYELVKFGIGMVRAWPVEDVPARVLKRVIRELTRRGPGGATFPENLWGADLAGGMEKP